MARTDLSLLFSHYRISNIWADHERSIVKMKRLRLGFLVGMLCSGEYASGEQQGKSNGGHTVHANGSIARWPGEHENVEQSHEFLGPEQSGNSEDQCGLGKNKHVQILHSQKVHSGGAILEIRT